jgi:hypothetical protein
MDWGRRPTYIGPPESNRYAHSPHRAVLPLQGAVLPLGRLWPFENQQRRSRRRRSGTTAGGSGSATRGAVLPRPPAVLPLRLRAEGEERGRGKGGTSRGSGNGTTAYKRYYRLLLPLLLPKIPTRRRPPRIEAAAAQNPPGSAAHGLQAVLPLRSGTTACGS